MPSLTCKGGAPRSELESPMIAGGNHTIISGVGEGFAVPGTIWYNPGRIRTIQMFRFYEFAQPFMLSYLVPRIPTLPSPCEQGEA